MNRPSIAIMRSFLGEISKECGSCDESQEIETLIGILNKITGSRSKFYLLKGEESNRKSINCSKMSTLDDVFDYNISARSRSSLGRRRTTTRIPKDLERLKDFSESKGVPCLARDVKNKRDFNWVTPAETVEYARLATTGENPSTALAEDVRNRLGLCHFQRGTHLIEMQIPASALELRAPTILEGTSGGVYRSDPRSDGWGRAVNLGTWSEGGDEAVCPVFEGGLVIDVHYLGRISGDVAIDHSRIISSTDPAFHWTVGDSL